MPNPISRAPLDEEGKVGRWLPNDPDSWWECDGSAPARCLRLHSPSVSACRACGTQRPPLPETSAPSAEDAIERIARNYVSEINFTRSVGVVDALLSYEDRKALVRAGMALRAVPVEGDEPVCYQLRQRGQSGHWLRWESYDSESMRDGFLPRDAEYELRTLYAHPAPDAEVRDA